MFNHVDTSQYKIPELECETLPTGRTYKTPEGNKYPSITTILSSESKKGLDEWRKRVGEKEANRISGVAAVRGESVHNLAEKYLNNDSEWHKGVGPVNKFTFSKIKKVLDGKVDNIWFQEIALYSDRLRLAGRVDCIAEFDGKLSVIDFKTSRKKKKKEWIEEYFIQTSFYAAAFYEMFGIPIKDTVVIIAPDHEDVQVFKEKSHNYLKRLYEVRKKFDK